jgi:transcriptional regulator with XRE-family HTH domain
MSKNKSKVSVAEYLSILVDSSDKTQRQIAQELGYENANIITMFKQGLTRVPLNMVGSIANVLEIDAGDFLAMVMNEYMPETFKALRPTLLGLTLTREEYEMVNMFRILQEIHYNQYGIKEPKDNPN